MLYCADVEFLCSPSWWNNNGLCRFRNIIYLFQRWFSSDFLSRFEAKVFFILYLCNVPSTKEYEEVADKDINQDTYYTLDSGMKFIIWPWQHNLTSFTYNRGTTVWLPFLFLHFTLFLSNSILSNLFLFFNYLSLLSFESFQFISRTL